MCSYVPGFSIRRYHELGASVDLAFMYNTLRKCRCCWSMKRQGMVQWGVMKQTLKIKHRMMSIRKTHEANVPVLVLVSIITEYLLLQVLLITWCCLRQQRCLAEKGTKGNERCCQLKNKRRQAEREFETSRWANTTHNISRVMASFYFGGAHDGTLNATAHHVEFPGVQWIGKF